MDGTTARGRPLPLEHLLHLTTPDGLYEHALGTAPRVANGMCVDDVARALVVMARMPAPTPTTRTMTTTCLRFLRDGQRSDGLMHNRRTAGRTWVDAASTGDHWGRALWAFGTAAAHLADEDVTADALRGADLAMRARSRYPRAMAYAALGAAQMRRISRDDVMASRLLLDARAVLPRFGSGESWPWPEARLTYANAVIPQAMVVIGVELGDDDLLKNGLRLLRWLVDEQTVDGHLSLVPAGGRGPGDARPGFDQQPIEAAVLAEAASTAYLATGDGGWHAVVDRCVAWFEGDNDSRVPMRDLETGGGYDGLEPAGVNRNQGAESTLAWLACLQLAQAQPFAAR
ncbi:glycosyltransferase [Cellulomonas persica]|uniref:Glycosyl transferase n=1 Tax=Cellulomonas persica TaxID=76861 RepID=A0A510UPA9_9CELL|nr:glycosyltransferase [Cellulomonas persica]GEK16497.1 glycosyl transferase [Cellulomonas persica]